MRRHILPAPMPADLLDRLAAVAARRDVSVDRLVDELLCDGIADLLADLLRARLRHEAGLDDPPDAATPPRLPGGATNHLTASPSVAPTLPRATLDHEDARDGTAG